MLFFIICFQGNLFGQEGYDPEVKLSPCFEAYDDDDFIRSVGYEIAQDSTTARHYATLVAQQILFSRAISYYFPEVIRCLDTLLSVVCVDIEQVQNDDGNYAAAVSLEVSRKALTQALDSVIEKKAKIIEQRKSESKEPIQFNEEQFRKFAEKRIKEIQEEEKRKNEIKQNEP